MADEFELIERYFMTPGAPGDGVWLGIGDDAAVLDVPSGCVVVDEMTVHPIPKGGDGYAFGSLALGDALRRCCATGASPRWLALALTLPEAEEAWLEGFARAIRDTERRHRVRLVGGDTTQGPGALSVAVFAVLAEGAGNEDAAAGARPEDSRKRE